MFSVVRPSTEPNCLNDEKYNTSEVVSLLEPMFFGKCYLCERDNLSDPEIEHFDPHLGDKTKKYSWNNLYYSCGRCNSIKSTTHKNLLDCCDASINIFKTIKCLLPSIPDEPVNISAELDAANQKTINTVELLRRCYNETNTPLRGITRSVLMESLFSHYTEFLTYRGTLRDKRFTEEEKALAKGRIKSMIKVSFPFSVFWRWHLLSDSFLVKELEGLIDF